MNAVVLNKEKTDVKFSFEVSAEVLEQVEGVWDSLEKFH